MLITEATLFSTSGCVFVTGVDGRRDGIREGEEEAPSGPRLVGERDKTGKKYRRLRRIFLPPVGLVLSLRFHRRAWETFRYKREDGGGLFAGGPSGGGASTPVATVSQGFAGVTGATGVDLVGRGDGKREDAVPGQWLSGWKGGLGPKVSFWWWPLGRKCCASMWKSVLTGAIFVRKSVILAGTKKEGTPAGSLPCR